MGRPSFDRRLRLSSRRALGSLAPCCAVMDLASAVTCLVKAPPENMLGLERDEELAAADGPPVILHEGAHLGPAERARQCRAHHLHDQALAEALVAARGRHGAGEALHRIGRRLAVAVQRPAERNGKALLGGALHRRPGDGRGRLVDEEGDLARLLPGTAKDRGLVPITGVLPPTGAIAGTELVKPKAIRPCRAR